MTAPSLGNVGGRAAQIGGDNAAQQTPVQARGGVGPIFLNFVISRADSEAPGGGTSTYRWINADANAHYEVVKATLHTSGAATAGTLQLRRVRGDVAIAAASSSNLNNRNISTAQSATGATNTLVTLTLATADSPDSGISAIGDRVLKPNDKLALVYSTAMTSLVGVLTVELQPVDTNLAT